jgi:hypothetical protein
LVKGENGSRAARGDSFTAEATFWRNRMDGMDYDRIDSDMTESRRLLNKIAGSSSTHTPFAVAVVEEQLLSLIAEEHFKNLPVHPLAALIDQQLGRKVFEWPDKPITRKNLEPVLVALNYRRFDAMSVTVRGGLAKAIFEYFGLDDTSGPLLLGPLGWQRVREKYNHFSSEATVVDACPPPFYETHSTDNSGRGWGAYRIGALSAAAGALFTVFAMQVLAPVIRDRVDARLRDALVPLEQSVTIQPQLKAIDRRPPHIIE